MILADQLTRLDDALNEFKNCMGDDSLRGKMKRLSLYSRGVIGHIYEDVMNQLRRDVIGEMQIQLPDYTFKRGDFDQLVILFGEIKIGMIYLNTAQVSFKQSEKNITNSQSKIKEAKAKRLESVFEGKIEQGEARVKRTTRALTKAQQAEEKVSQLRDYLLAHTSLTEKT